MASYKIRIKRSATKEIDAIADRKQRRLVVARIEGLAQEPRPRGCQKVVGMEAYRIRQGNYRIIYTIEDDVLTIEIVKVGHRREVYRGSR